MTVEVTTSKQAKAFVDLPRSLYKNDAAWICALDNEIESIFDPQKNSFFHHGICNRWIAVNENGETVGRIAAFINYQKTNGCKEPTGGIGFFECINDRQMATELFCTAKHWLQAQGMNAMDGPI